MALGFGLFGGGLLGGGVRRLASPGLSMGANPMAGPRPAPQAQAPKISAPTAPPKINQIITSAANKYGIDPNLMLNFAHIESRFNPSATSPTGAKGLFQFVPGTAKRYGLNKPYDPVANADAAARLLLDNKKYLSSRLGRDPRPGELYLAHQQGAAGAAALLANPGANVVDALAPAYKGNRSRAARAIRVNGGSLGMTAGEFAGRWTKKFGGAGQIQAADNAQNVPLPRPAPDRQMADVPLPQGRPMQIADAPAEEAKSVEVSAPEAPAVPAAEASAIPAPEVPEVKDWVNKAADVQIVHHGQAKPAQAVEPQRQAAAPIGLGQTRQNAPLPPPRPALAARQVAAPLPRARPDIQQAAGEGLGLRLARRPMPPAAPGISVGAYQPDFSSGEEAKAPELDDPAWVQANAQANGRFVEMTPEQYRAWLNARRA